MQDWESISARLTDQEAKDLAKPNGTSGMSAIDLQNKGGVLSDIGQHMGNSKQPGLNELDLKKDGQVDDSYNGGYQAANPDIDGGTEPQAELDRNVKKPDNERVQPSKAPHSSLPDPKGKRSNIAKPGAKNPG